jgi:hypothetical protein
MIVERLTARVKPGCYDELMEMLKKEKAKARDPSRIRILTPGPGPWDMIIYETVYEDRAEQDRDWEEWWSKPETAEFMKKWNQLRESGGGLEVFDIVE